MSMGGGGGGILAGIGHISVLGIADPNAVKALNQILELASRFVAVPLYWRQRRVHWRLAACLALGAPFGAVAGSWLSSAYLADMATYRVVFGGIVACVGARVLYESWRHGRAPASIAAPSFNPWLAIAGGFAISFAGAALGIAGGFLVTPFIASILLFPMFLAVGTGLVALMVPLVASVLAYVWLGAAVDPLLVAIEVPGVLLGSLIGPAVNRRMNERTLKSFVACVLLAIGAYYVTVY